MLAFLEVFVYISALVFVFKILVRAFANEQKNITDDSPDDPFFLDE